MSQPKVAPLSSRQDNETRKTYVEGSRATAGRPALAVPYFLFSQAPLGRFIEDAIDFCCDIPRQRLWLVFFQNFLNGRPDSSSEIFRSTRPSTSTRKKEMHQKA